MFQKGIVIRKCIRTKLISSWCNLIKMRRAGESISGGSRVTTVEKDDIGGSHHVSLDIDRLVESVEGKLKFLPTFSDKCSIWRVPKRLRELNAKAYTPQLVSIGPLHHGNEELKEMEEHKRLYLGEFLKMSKVDLKDFIAIIAERETRLRTCYSETLENLSKGEFVEMVLMDGSFLVMLLLKNCFQDLRGRNIDRIFSQPRMIREIRFDVCLLENQLPFFILEDLLKLSGILDHKTEYSMIKLTLMFLSCVWITWVPETILDQINPSQVCHLVDFLRLCQLPTQESQQKELTTLKAPTVEELRRAGVKFKLGSSTNLLDIKFDADKGTLEIPRLSMVDQTEILFRNVQAFEQCNCSTGRYVGNYITMMNLLVRDAKDVEILVKHGIVENGIDDNEAASRLLSSLDKENLVNFNNFYFSGVIVELNKYIGKRMHKWKAALKQKYFYNPWTIISVVVAAVFLLNTLTQLVFSIIKIAK